MNKENGIKRLNRLRSFAKEYRDENTQVVKLSQAIEVVNLIDEPKPLTEDQAWKVIADIYNQDADRWEDAKNHYLNSIKEPEKPVVPQFVADWYEESADLEDDLYDLIGETYTSNDKRTEMEEFILSADINPIETIIKMKNGYEVEKEPLFHMPVPHLSEKNAYYFKREDGTIGMLDSEHVFSETIYHKFTQSELEKYFPDIKHMAEEVHE